MCFEIIILILLNEFVKNQNTSALVNSILLCILYNYLLDVWLTPSITIFFRLKCSWEYRTFGSFCKVQGRTWKL